MTKPTPSPQPHDPGAEATRAGSTVDMSPQAIDRRLRDLAQLWRLGMSLQTGRWIGSVHDRDEGRTEG